MEDIIPKVINSILIGIGFYLCWRVLPVIKEKLVKKLEGWLEKHGLYDHYINFHKILKIFLYIVLVLMVLIPVLFFIVVMVSQK